MATKKEEVKFEDNLAELENIVRKLESGANTNFLFIFPHFLKNTLLYSI